MAAAQVATLSDGQKQVGKFADVPTQSEAANKLNVSERAVRTAKKVQETGTSGLIEAVQRALPACQPPQMWQRWLRLSSKESLPVGA
jgi:hypothetical protein